MAFIEVTGKRNSSARVTPPVGVALHQGSKKEGPRLNLIVSSDVMARLGWHPLDKIVVLEGEGDDACFLQFRKADACQTSFILSVNSKAKGNVSACRVIVNARHLKSHRVGVEPVTLTEAVHQVFNKTLTVYVPFLMPISSD